MATGAGGKMVRDGRINRYKASSSTPYDRPSNPNWISKLPRAIVSGAGVLLNSVFGPDPSSSSSSSTSSSSSASGVDGDKEVHADRVLAYEKGDAPFLEPGSDVAGGSGSKQLIERLIVQHNFSREECDRFTGLIKARVVYTPENFDGEGFPLWERQKQPFEKDEDLPSYYSEAAMEAKKWFEGRKLGLSSEFDLDKGTSSLSPISAHLNSGETGSPADMARSYMKERRPWSSQHLNHTGSTAEVPDPKEDAFLSIGWNSLSPPPNSQLKRNSPITGSWNISEEIRRVRSRATKEMLRTVSSPKVDKSSAFMPGSPLILRINWSDSTPVDKNAEQRTANNILATNLGDDEVSNATRTLDVSSETAIPEVAQVLPGTVSDGVVAANGLAAFALSPSAGLNSEKEGTRVGEESNVRGDSGLPTSLSFREDCKLLSEASVDVPGMDENEGLGGGSEGFPLEELSEDVTISVARKSGVVEKQGGRPVRNTRRVRGRSK